jgi:hypothetical protein
VTSLTVYAIASILVLGDMVLNCLWVVRRIPKVHRPRYVASVCVLMGLPASAFLPKFIAGLMPGRLLPDAIIPVSPVGFVFQVGLVVVGMVGMGYGLNLMLRQAAARHNWWR